MEIPMLSRKNLYFLGFLMVYLTFVTIVYQKGQYIKIKVKFLVNELWLIYMTIHKIDFINRRMRIIRLLIIMPHLLIPLPATRYQGSIKLWRWSTSVYVGTQSFARLPHAAQIKGKNSEHLPNLLTSWYFLAESPKDLLALFARGRNWFSTFMAILLRNLQILFRKIIINLP